MLWLFNVFKQFNMLKVAWVFAFRLCQFVWVVLSFAHFWVRSASCRPSALHDRFMMFTFRIDSLSARRFAFCLCIQSYTFTVSFIEQSPLIFAQPSPISLAALQQLKRFAVRSHHLIHSHLFLITFHLYFYTHKSSIVSLDSFDLLELTPLDSRPSHPEVNCPSEPSSNFIVWICLFLCHSLLSHLHIHTTHSSIDPYRAPIVASSISVSFLIPTFFSIIFVISAYFGL
jgi:hypothetical protein